MSLETDHKVQRIDREAFLRSINLRYDAEHPERIAHFRPTAKSIPLLRALAAQKQDRAFFAIAPYGTGKSLAATYLLHLTENRPEAEDALSAIEKRLEDVSPQFAAFAATRRKEETHGLVLTLHGHEPNLAEAIARAALEAMGRMKLGRQARPLKDLPCSTMDEATAFLDLLAEKAGENDLDRILVIWDEFGRHLESLLSEGRPEALLDLQQLAEYASRAGDLPMALGLLLHQGLLHYAGSAPQSVRSEWTKVEGRFKSIQYVDDSKEMYRLVAEVAASRYEGDRPTKRRAQEVAGEAQELGLFPDFTKKELTELFHRAYPLEPATLHLLPRLAARAAQNERTLFSFLHTVEFPTDGNARLDPAALFDYFSPAMRSDTGVGGTYKQWLETQSAITKTGDEPEATRALKTACLLALGTSGERSRAGRELLLSALRGYEPTQKETSVVTDLIARKLLLHRKHSDAISVWHGTDADLRGRLEEEKDSLRATFELREFLTKEAPPPIRRPVMHNAERGVRRYLEGEYHTLGSLETRLDVEVTLQDLPVGCDGKIFYLVTEATEELDEAIVIAQEFQHDRIVLALPAEPVALTEAALEVASLLRMARDQDLVASDPLVLPEIQQMTDDARAHLQQLLDRLVSPSPGGPRWFHRGAEYEVECPSRLRATLSEIMEEVFPLTPRIHNEMIVRRKPSGPVINSRKKLLLGVLERSGQENLGIQGNFPDASMFRCVLRHTGIYRQEEDGRWGWAQPEELKDEGLRDIWGQFHVLFTEPSKQPKNLASFFARLQEPPYGLRPALIPIFFGVALKAFPTALSLTHKGSYVTDILPTVIEDLCKNPEDFGLLVLGINEEQVAYLQGFYELFTGKLPSQPNKADLIRLCFDALERWKADLPPGAATTRSLDDRTETFRTAALSQNEPSRLLFELIPKAVDTANADPKILQRIGQAKEEIEGIQEAYRTQAIETLRRTLVLAGNGNGNCQIQVHARDWARCFPRAVLNAINDGVAQGLVTRMKMPYDTEAKLLDSLASLLVGKTFNRWDDSTFTAFEKELRAVVHRVEDTALSVDREILGKNGAVDQVSHLIRSRLQSLYSRLESIAGRDRAQQIASDVLAAPQSKKG